MKLGLLKTIAKSELAKGGGEIPKWVDAFLGPLNSFIERVGIALQGRLTFEDNFLCKVTALEFTHATELLVNPSIDGGGALRVTGVLPLSAGGLAIDKFKWTQKDTGSVGITLSFENGVDPASATPTVPATKATCRILILLG